MARTVVVVDDSSFIVKQIVEFFTDELKFLVVTTGNDGNDAVNLYRKLKPDLITLDIKMPNKTGLEAIEEIISEFPDAKILMISAVRGDAMLECMNKGAKGYIEKPLRFRDAEFVQDFKETISEVFDD